MSLSRAAGGPVFLLNTVFEPPPRFNEIDIFLRYDDRLEGCDVGECLPSCFSSNAKM